MNPLVGRGSQLMQRRTEVLVEAAIGPRDLNMYIDSIEIQDFRTFRKGQITFCHPDQKFVSSGHPDSAMPGQVQFPKPMLPNVNLLLGNNGLGKTTLLKAVALAALGPAVRSSGIYASRLVRREPGAAGGTRRRAAR